MNIATSQKPGWIQAMNSVVERYQADWIALRRYLHQHPELSGAEYETTQHLAGVVDSLGIAPHIVGGDAGLHPTGKTSRGGRGLLADFVSAPELAGAKRFALRGDIDALPIADGKSVEYRSCVDSVMHACGHDVHASVLVAALQILSVMHREGALPHPIAVRGIFQPAEETAEGARYMISHGALKDVDRVLALHVDPTRSVGRIGILPGTFTAHCDIFEVRIKGRGGHGGRPHLSQDPIDAGAEWLHSVYRAIPRLINAHETVAISVGQFQAGHSANVIPDEASLRGSLRSLDSDARAIAHEHIGAIGEALERRSGCEVNFRLLMTAPAVINDAALVDRLSKMAALAVDSAAAEVIEYPSMGSEDFSYYLERCPGAMFRLGIAGPQIGHEPLHTPNFDVDECAIAVGAKLMAAMAIDHFAA